MARKRQKYRTLQQQDNLTGVNPPLPDTDLEPEPEGNSEPDTTVASEVQKESDGMEASDAETEVDDAVDEDGHANAGGNDNGSDTDHDDDAIDQIAVGAVGEEDSNSAKKISNKPADMEKGEPVPVKYYTLQQRGNLVVFGPPLRSSSSERESDTENEPTPRPPINTEATAGQLQTGGPIISRKRSLRKTLRSPRSRRPTSGGAVFEDSATGSDSDDTSDSDEEGTEAGKIQNETPVISAKRGRGRPRKKGKRSSGDGVVVPIPPPAIPASSDRSYACVSCDKTFRELKFLRHHRLSYHRLDESRFPYACKFAACERRYETIIETENHERCAHPKGSTGMMLTCAVCGKACCNKSGMMSHMKTHQNPSGMDNVQAPKPTANEDQDHEQKETFKCDLCPREFVSKAGFTLHKATHPSSNQTQFACSHCSKKYLSKAGLRKHMKTHTV